MTAQIKTDCDTCKEAISIEAKKCPHCGQRQWTSKGRVYLLLAGGVVLLPLTAIELPVFFEYGIGATGFIALFLAMIGPVLIMAGIQNWKRRTDLIKSHSSDS